MASLPIDTAKFTGIICAVPRLRGLRIARPVSFALTVTPARPCTRSVFA